MVGRVRDYANKLSMYMGYHSELMLKYDIMQGVGSRDFIRHKVASHDERYILYCYLCLNMVQRM